LRHNFRLGLSIASEAKSIASQIPALRAKAIASDENWLFEWNLALGADYWSLLSELSRRFHAVLAASAIFFCLTIQ
jgi:hypothetical protein